MAKTQEQLFQEYIAERDFIVEDIATLAENGKKGEKQLTYNSNAYHVDFYPTEVVINHMWVEEWGPVKVTPDEFISAVRAIKDPKFK